MNAAPASVRAAGFTVLEMLVVVAILALSAAIVAPRLSGPPDGLVLQAAAGELSNRLRALRMAAIRANTDQTLTVEPEARAYSTSLDTRPHVLSPKVSVAVSGSGLETPAPGAVLIRFRPDGSARDAHIVLRQGASTADISIEWLTGASRIAWRQ